MMEIDFPEQGILCLDILMKTDTNLPSWEDTILYSESISILRKEIFMQGL